MCLVSYANNKGADQPAHSRSLISAFVVRCLDSIISLDSIAEISRLYLASVAAQVGLCLAWSETPEDTFWHVVALLITVSSILQNKHSNEYQYNEEMFPSFTNADIRKCQHLNRFIVVQCCLSKTAAKKHPLVLQWKCSMIYHIKMDFFPISKGWRYPSSVKRSQQSSYFDLHYRSLQVYLIRICFFIPYNYRQTSHHHPTEFSKRYVCHWFNVTLPRAKCIYFKWGIHRWDDVRYSKSSTRENRLSENDTIILVTFDHSEIVNAKGNENSESIDAE